MSELNEAVGVQAPGLRRGLYLAGFAALVAACVYLGVTADDLAQYATALAPLFGAATSLLAALNVGEEVRVVNDEDDSIEDPDGLAGGDELEDEVQDDFADDLHEDQ